MFDDSPHLKLYYDGEIIEEQEKVLKGLENLEEMESSAYNNYGQVSLTFPVGYDLDAALLRVSNKMNEVSDYPENAERPAIEAAGAQSSPVIWIMLKTLPVMFERDHPCKPDQ